MNPKAKMQNLPIGINTLSSIRENDMVYIDKTPLIWQMVQQPARFFLSRPRRFGKSLLVDTFKELFEGNRDLFLGLYIEDKWDWSKTYPVIKFDLLMGLLNLARCWIYASTNYWQKTNSDLALLRVQLIMIFLVFFEMLSYKRVKNTVKKSLY